MTPNGEQQLFQDIGAIKSTLDAHTGTLGSINSALNGKDGLVTTVAGHYTKLGNWTRVFWIVITPLLTALSGAVIYAFMWGIQHIK
jgi:hypothetical protein